MDQIVVIDTGYESYDAERNIFSRNGFSLLVQEGSSGDHTGKFELARNAVGILVRGTRIGEMEMEQMPRLKAIVRYGTGYENIDLEAARSRGIRVANIQGYASHAVSDHALALMLACARGLGVREAGTSPGFLSRAFGKPSRKDVFELHDKTLGIIGIGRIGSHFSKKASPLFKRTLAFDPYQTGEYMRNFGAVKADLEKVLTDSHVISLHCILTGETHHMLNETGFRSMRNRPVIINTSRGPVVDEKALLRALDSGLVHSAGLDVFEKEPPGQKQSALLEHSRVMVTPHIGWYSVHAAVTLQKRAARNMVALLTGGETGDEL
jgi:D-3-phosphoglycerate dehydrogenase